jgi:general secretion pathway protein G
MRVDSRTFVRRARRRALSRGLTLVELVIVITIIGTLTAAIAFGVLQVKKRADVKTTATACSTIRQAATLWKQDHTGDCPTVDDLKSSKFLDRNFTPKDPFGNGFKIQCTDDGDIIVSSAGPDKKDGTDDDIIFPPPEGKTN